MDNLNWIWILIVFGLLHQIIGAVLGPEDSPIIITNAGKYEGKVPGSNWTVVCKGEHEVEWMFEDSQTGEIKDLNGTVTETRNPGDGYPFTSTLSIYNITDSNYGTYVCQFKDPALSKDNISVKLSLQNNSLLVEDGFGPYYVIDATVGDEVLFPCKPINSSINVQFLDQIEELTPNVSDSRLTFDPDNGFRLEKLKIPDSQLYTCKATYGSQVENRHRMLHVQALPSLKQPVIDGTKADSVEVGGTIVLICSYEATGLFKLAWTDPSSVLINSSRVTQDSKCLPDVKTGGNSCNVTLTVRNVSKDDEDNYYCTVSALGAKKFSNYSVRVYGDGDEFLNVSTQSSEIEVNSGDTAQWVILMDGFPHIQNFSWQDRNNVSLNNKRRFEIVQRKLNKEVVLKILKAELSDSGPYYVVANHLVHNTLRSFTLQLRLTVNAEPVPELSTFGLVASDFFILGQNYTFVCNATGFPYPNIQWKFEECDFDTSGAECDNPVVIPPTTMSTYDSEFVRGTRSSLTFTAGKRGYLLCEANNTMSMKAISVEKKINIIDFYDDSEIGFSITGDSEPIEKRSATYQCAVVKTDYERNLKWCKNETVDNGSPTCFPPNVEMDGISVFTNGTEWSYKSFLVIKNINEDKNGEYFCTATDNKGNKTSRSINVKVQKLTKPYFENTTLNDSVLKVQQWEKLPVLVCKANGVPLPTLRWLKDGIPSDSWPVSLKKCLSNSSRASYLNLPSKPEYSGKYVCEARNEQGVAQKFVAIEIYSGSPISWYWLAVFGILVSLIIILCIFLAVKQVKERKRRLFLIEKRARDFQAGDTANINPDLPVHDQVNLLPYYDTWEFPKENLKLGMQLGSGAFGVVRKADALGIEEAERWTTVAVKMVKAHANESHINALISELKIMVHLGRHVNVVNLLGACTKDLAKKGELLVIVEYCKYGSILSYLHRHKNQFVDQLDPITGLVDPTVCFQNDRFCPSSMTKRSMDRLNYASLTFTESRNSRPAANGYLVLEEIPGTNQNQNQKKDNSGSYRPPPVSYNPSEDYTGANVQSMCTDMSFVSNSVTGTDGRRGSSSSNNNWEGHYLGDYQQRDVEPITTTDVICWSFQIARGMEYLASRKVLHGDLAARNILLADNGVVKICDFGLAKSLYQDYKYKKKSEGVLLPVKWMAVESIYYGVFSAQSDVWSYGVVLWELFTLGKTPYPGMEADQKFYTMLNDGYRMERPPLAPNSIYEVMRDCWHSKPNDRPTFSALVDRLGNLIESGLREHYIDLNDNYSRMNRDWLEGKEDYLLQMSGPDLICEEATPDEVVVTHKEEVQSPTYVNIEPKTPNSPLSSDYLLPNQINSMLNSNYKNVTGDNSSSQLQPLANNAGYVYMNSQNDLVIQNSFPNSISNPCVESPVIVKDTAVENTEYYQVKTPPPLHNNNDKENASNNKIVETDAKQVKVIEDEDELTKHNNPQLAFQEIQGISNIHYVPNSFIFAPIISNNNSHKDDKDPEIMLTSKNVKNHCSRL